MQIFVGSNFFAFASRCWSSLRREAASTLSFSKTFSFVVASFRPATMTWMRSSSTVISAISESVKLLVTERKKSSLDWPADCFKARVAERRLKIGCRRLKKSSRMLKTEGAGPNNLTCSSASGSTERSNCGPKQLLR